jgi:hypothetical protein
LLILALDVLLTVAVALTVGQRRWVKVLYALVTIGSLVICCFAGSLEELDIFPAWLGSDPFWNMLAVAILLYIGCAAWCLVEVLRVSGWQDFLSIGIGGLLSLLDPALLIVAGLALFTSPLMLIGLSFLPGRRRCPECKQWIVGEKATTCPHCQVGL